MPRNAEIIECLSLGRVSLANCYFAHNSSGFPVLLRFYDAQFGRSCHPLHRHPGPVARTWRRPFPSCGVPSHQAPTSDRESLPATIPQFTLVRPHPRRLAGALGASNSSPPFCNRTEALDTASSSQSYELSLIHISEPTRLGMISYAVFCL